MTKKIVKAALKEALAQANQTLTAQEDRAARERQKAREEKEAALALQTKTVAQAKAVYEVLADIEKTFAAVGLPRLFHDVARIKHHEPETGKKHENRVTFSLKDKNYVIAPRSVEVHSGGEISHQWEYAIGNQKNDAVVNVVDDRSGDMSQLVSTVCDWATEDISRKKYTQLVKVLG